MPIATLSPSTTDSPLDASKSPARSMHLLGVVCGIAAGIWLGASEAPTKLVDVGLSPFAISLCMVAGVFTARWSFPTLLRGTGYVYHDLRAKPHLIVWAILAGALWAVANTLTVYAIRDVGLTIAFPLWNTNCLVGLLWGRLLFRELQGASRANIAKSAARHMRHHRLGHHVGFQCSERHRWPWCSRDSRLAGRTGREFHVGNDVRALPQGIPERNESIVLRHRLHRRRAVHLFLLAQRWEVASIISPLSCIRHAR